MRALRIAQACMQTLQGSPRDTRKIEFASAPDDMSQPVHASIVLTMEFKEGHKLSTICTSVGNNMEPYAPGSQQR